MALSSRGTLRRHGDHPPGKPGALPNGRREGNRGSLGVAVLRAQQEERRRIGRELHDATAQLLVAIDLSVIQLKAMHGDRPSGVLFAEIRQTLDRLHREIRTVSYALHPPLLQRGRLFDAIAALSRGFSARTGLRIAVRPPRKSGKLSEAAEETLYRLVQEALVNVYRHARASEVRIRLTWRRRGGLYLLVADDGIGLKPEAGSSVMGVGIAGMRARIEALDGRVSVRQLACGTVVAAAVPPRRRPTRLPESAGQRD